MNPHPIPVPTAWIANLHELTLTTHRLHSSAKRLDKSHCTSGQTHQDQLLGLPHSSSGLTHRFLVRTASRRFHFRTVARRFRTLPGQMTRATKLLATSESYLILGYHTPKTSKDTHTAISNPSSLDLWLHLSDNNWALFNFQTGPSEFGSGAHTSRWLGWW